MNLHELLENIMNNYNTEKNNPFKGNNIASLLKKGLTDIVSSDLLNGSLVTKGSGGKGRWAVIPWIGIFDSIISTSALRGFYIVYLFSADMERVYLSLNQGYTFYKETYRTEALHQIKKTASSFQHHLTTQTERMHFENLNLTNHIKFGTDLPKGYEVGNILSIEYTKDELPSNDILISDLKDMIICFSELKSQLLDNTNFSQSVDFILYEDNGYYDLSQQELQTLSKRIPNTKLTKVAYTPKFQAQNIDFSQKNKANAKIGYLGEKLVLANEKKALKKYPDLQNRVKHVSHVEGDGLGYDILSFDKDGNKKYIEVKTTTSNENTPFFISRNELAFAKGHAAHYFLYRLYNFSKLLTSENIDYFTITNDIETFCQLEPVSYIALPR
ncbi:MrcB family domain-containing protein [Loigolactobacillus bifermentans]|uniref:MrcB family domain-containing protein n=1 Tax=Loigolactobacillus bifermentans TaxID=1607 RepID=UPI000B2AEFB4|nr:DUF3578 domain-containing protein [Loigolactobacillus bifermentans]